MLDLINVHSGIFLFLGQPKTKFLHFTAAAKSFSFIYTVPIIKSNNFGHCDKKTVIPIGTKARIDTSKDKKIILLEECVI